MIKLEDENKMDIEKMLIKSAHSDEECQKYFMNELSNQELFNKILQIVEESESGDAKMEGAYWISKFDKKILEQDEQKLLVLMDCEWDSVAVHIMMALSKIRSEQALIKIIEDRIKPNLYWEAMAIKNYLQINMER